MDDRTLQNVLTLIAAVTAALSSLGAVIVSVLNAVRGKTLEDKMDQHEERATARAAMIIGSSTKE